MSTEQGDLGVILAGSDVVGQITASEYTETNRTRDITVAGGGGEQWGPTINGSAGTIEALIDRADAGQTALAAGNVVTIQLRPQGTGTGLPQIEIANAVIQSLRERLIVPDDYNRVTFTWQGGAVNRAQQA